MSFTNYPNGWPFGVTIRGVPFQTLYSGKVFWVDSVYGSANNSGTFQHPLSSIVRALTKTKSGRGDIIVCKPGHVESVIAAGGLAFASMTQVAVVFLGEGTSRATIKFGTGVVVGADMNINSVGITLIRPRFLANIDALTGPIDVNAADFAIIDGLYVDQSAKDTTDCIVADANATRLYIDGWRYIEGGGGTQKQSNIQVNGVDDAFFRNIHIAGDFATGNFENVTDEMLNAFLENLYLKNTNASPTPAMVIDANATGYAKNVKCRVASGTTFVSNVGKINWSNDCEGFNADGGAGDPIGTAISSGIEGKIDVIDGYHDVPTADVATNTVMRDVLGNKTDAAVNAKAANKSVVAYLKGILDEIAVAGADNTDNAFINDVIGQKTDAAAAGAVTTTDTLVAYIKQLVTGQIIIDEFHDVPAANNVLNAQINEVIGNKEDTAAAGAVTTTDTIVGYIKQLVTAAIVEATLSGSRKKVASVSLVAADLTGTVTRFTITGGPIKILSLGLWVSTAIPAGANTLQFGYTPAGGGGANTLSGATDTASAAADQLFMLDGVKATGPVKTTDVGVLAGGQLLVSTPIQGVILAPGVIQTIFSAGPPVTGAATLFMEWEPLTATSVVA